MWRSARRLIAVSGVLIGSASLAGAQPFAYVVNSTDDTVSVIDTEALAVVATIPVEAGAWQLAVAADERYVYTTSLGAAEGVISVISTTERRVVKQIELFRSDPDDIVVSPCGRFLYVTRVHVTTQDEPGGPTDGILLRVNVASSFEEAIRLPDVPLVLAFAPDGSVLYAAASSGILAIDPATHTVLRFIAVPGAPQDMVLSSGWSACLCNG